MPDIEPEDRIIKLKKRIMIVDDEEDFLEITKMNLEKTGNYQVMALPDAKDIIAKLHQFKPDVLLLDILMPGMDGLTACEMLNGDSLGIITPIIIISALTSDHDKLSAYKLGIVDYLTKPVSKNTLITCIEKAQGYKRL